MKYKIALNDAGTEADNYVVAVSEAVALMVSNRLFVALV